MYLRQVRDVALDVHHGVVELVKRTRFARTNTLEGACAVASHCLVQVLNNLGQDADLVVGRFKKPLKYAVSYQHAWVQWHRWNIDITACQFEKEYRGVYVTKRTDSRYLVDYVGSKAYDEVEDWMDQAPSRHRKSVKTVVLSATSTWSNLASTGIGIT